MSKECDGRPENPERTTLGELLERAKSHKPTLRERLKQRVSFVMGQTETSRERVLAALPDVVETLALIAEVAALRADNARLREALHSISGMSREMEHDLFSATQVARAALSEPAP